MNSDHRFFNPNIINSFRSTLKNIHKIEESTSARNLAQWRERRAREREEAARKSAEYKERTTAQKKGRAELQADLDAQIAQNMAGGKMDQYQARKAVLDAWAQDPEKQKRSQELGLGRVGRKGGGMVGWNFENQAAADESKKRGEEQLAAWRAEDARRKENEAEPTPEPRPRPGPGQAGGPGGYIDPNSPAGRVLGQIQRGELPPDVLDTTRDSHRRVRDAVNASPDPNNPEKKLTVPETELRGPRTPPPAPEAPRTPAPQDPAPEAPRPPAPEAPRPPAPEAPAPEAPRPPTELERNPNPNTNPEAESWRERARRQRESRQRQVPTDFNDLWSKNTPPSIPQLAADFMTTKSTKSTRTVRRMPIIPQSRVV